MTPKTLYQKLFDAHTVSCAENGERLLYIDRHIVHEVTSPQAFEGLKINNRDLWRKNSIIAVPDHNVPTRNHREGSDSIVDDVSRQQVKALEKNAEDFSIFKIPLHDVRQGIVHVIGPELGASLPGMTIVCGDSHTSTHGALGCLAQGIGTSEVEHVMATQCLRQRPLKNMLVKVTGQLRKNVSAKDVILAIIGEIGTAGGSGYAIEFAGQVFTDMSVEGRMTVCNMSIEAGAQCGLMAVDDKVIDYVTDRPFSPQPPLLEKAVEYWRTLKSDEAARFDKVVEMDGSAIQPQVTWGTSPEMVCGVNERIPTSSSVVDSTAKKSLHNALNYMGLQEGLPVSQIPLDYVFIGSCTNSRIEDLRVAAAVVEGKSVAQSIQRAMVVPGSGLVRRVAEQEGLDKIFIDAGFEWRESGCSMCLGMNEDQLPEGKHCASTSNRNFEGRQGKGGRTHLVSPVMAAAASIAGRFVDVSRF